MKVTNPHNAAPGAVDLNGARILIVDDDRTTCLMLRKVMEQDGYLVQVVSNGIEAIKACETAEQDLILLDYVLPDIDGTQVCAAIRKQQPYASVPILVLTSRYDGASVEAALSAGASDFITKPFIVRVLRQRVRYLLAARKAERLMRHLAYHDPLTGIPNRAYFNEQLSELLAQPGTEYSPQHAVLCLDLDRFKIVNDSCGHSAGDELLRQVAALLLSKVRQTDILARLGGDEFAALLIDCSKTDASAIAEKLREAVSQFCFFWEGKTFTIGVSIGIAVLNGLERLPANVLSAADAACYSAKNSGRNRVMMHDFDSDQSRRRNDINWPDRIAKALEENRFALQAQRIIPNTDETDPGHFEILPYMLDTDGTPIASSGFASHAERYSLMPAIDRWVVSNALRLLQQRGAWETASGFWISISGSALGDPRLGQFLIEELTRFKVPADRLCLQITEAAITADMTVSSRFTELLAPYGVLFAVDEFNAGLSSFRALLLGPLRFLKFDSALFPRISSSPLDFALVKAINDVAHSANIQTVVKQLEETKTLLDFRVIGTDFLQGASVSRPEPLNALQLKAEALAP